MTEQDYINAGDLRTILLAQEVLSHLNADNQPAIKNEELMAMHNTLFAWYTLILGEVSQARNKTETPKEQQ